MFGDDGEKFGTWPGTRKTVYEEGWLREFFAALCDNADWLRTATFAETLDAVPPAGRISVPDGSYREMTEWALPAARQTELHDLCEAGGSGAHGEDWPALKPYVRGGNWRNFRTKYPEAREMAARMQEVSDRLAAAERDGAADPGDLEAARVHLYKAQCNCSYWHGAFGGLYLPHLRNAVYTHLIEADTLLERAAGRPCGGRSGRWCGVAASDFDLDGRKEVKLCGDRLAAYLAPARGGVLYELDVRGAAHNALATLDRTPEPYHAKILAHAAGGGDRREDGGAAVSIHDLVQFKQPDLDAKIAYDARRTKGLVDHFLEPGLTADAFRRGGGSLCGAGEGVFETVVRRSKEKAEAVMTRTARLSRFSVGVTKTVSLAAGGNSLAVRYEFDGLPAGRPVHFASATHVAGMAGGAEDRYFHDESGDRRGTLDAELDLRDATRLGLCDEWLGLDVALEWDVPGGVWTYPVETVSGSEAGFESVFQSCAVVPHWEFVAPADGRWSVGLTLTCDASAARAKRLEGRPAARPDALRRAA